MVDIREVIFPMPETVWEESDFEEELIWIPYPSHSFDPIKTLYNDDLLEQEEQLLEQNKDKWKPGNRYNWERGSKLVRRTAFRRNDKKENSESTNNDSKRPKEKKEFDKLERVSTKPVKPSHTKPNFGKKSQAGVLKMDRDGEKATKNENFAHKIKNSGNQKMLKFSNLEDGDGEEEKTEEDQTGSGEGKGDSEGSPERKSQGYFDRTLIMNEDEKGEKVEGSDPEPDILADEESALMDQREARAKRILRKYVHHFIPCLLHLPEEIVGDKIIVYFHANGEDIGLCYNFCFKICQKIKVKKFEKIEPI